MPEDSSNPKRPASQYYWGDWFKDLALQSCSLPARGLWHEMNCLMHQGEPYGHLTLPNGKPMGPQQLANLCKIPVPVCKRLLEELMSNGVPSMDESTGAFFSRRMVRDEALRETRAEAGRLNGFKGRDFGSLGAEHGVKGGRPRKAETPTGNPGETPPPEPGEKPPQNPHPSSSSSSSSSSSASHTDSPAGSPTAEKPSSKPRGSKRVPEDFEVTADMEAWAKASAPLVDLERETENFRDWEFNRVRSDWPATWRSWMRKAQGDAEKRAPRLNGRDTVDDWTRNAL